MPRQSRIDAPGALHHVICRGIERREIFTDNVDRDDFVCRLGNILTETSTRCFAWALIPNHFHLLLQTGPTTIATVMRRLLTGYAIRFNRRHRRHGHLFQNRYKSILCQEEPYLLELVRYIHLNPLRAGVVTTLEDLAVYPYSGHHQILDDHPAPWLASIDVLGRFGQVAGVARQAYGKFVADGISQGSRLDLIGGGLLRSAGGWQQIKAATEAGDFLKSDERILGDSLFVEETLRIAEETLERKHAYARQGIGLEELFRLVAGVLSITVDEIRMVGKQPRRVQARSLFSYWAVRELGITTTTVAGILSMSQPAASLSVQRGERLVMKNGWQLERLINRKL